MHFAQIALPALLGLPLSLATPLAARSDIETLLDLNDQAVSALQSDDSNTKRGSTCNVFNARVRRDW